MADYLKKVIYLSYLEQGNKVRSAGFIKVEISGDKWAFHMHVSGMTELPEKKYDIYVVNIKGKEYGIGNIFLHKGSGEWKESGTGAIPGAEGMAAREVGEFRIKISATEMIEGKFQAFPAAEEKREIYAAEKKERPERKESRLLGRGGSFSKSGNSHKEKKDIKEEQDIKEERQTEPKKKSNREALDGNREKEVKIEEIILNDKWEQLCRMYPVVHPYEDEREYISIQPKDFVVMTGDYQHLANNSFLLHGFYNYRHIVLGREPVEETGAEKTKNDRKTERVNSTENKGAYGDFFLGVPGVYYEREKMVALMFGFEAFECCGGKAEPGKFGYYLRRVRI